MCLYYYQLYSNLLKNYDFEITTIDNIINNKDSNIFIIIIEFNKIASWDDKICDYIKNNNIRILIHHQEFYPRFEISDALEKLKNIDLILLTYCNHNILSLKNNPNINKLLYLPILYHHTQEEIYNKYVTNKIEWENKDIDILLTGTMYDVRSDFIDKFKKKIW